MKLKNKKTGEIIENAYIRESHDFYNKRTIAVFVQDGNHPPERVSTGYETLAELNEDWEDYEEPEGWCITMYGGISRITKNDEILFTDLKEIGNWFNDKESAYDALDKLKAWKRLEDLGTEILGWEIRDMPTGGNWQTVNVKLNVKARKEPMELLDLLFGGEE